MEISIIWIGQIVGFIAYAISVVSFTHKKDRNFLNYMLGAHVFWMVHFALINAFSGSLSQIVSLLRTGSARFVENPAQRKMMLVPVLLGYIIVGYKAVHHPLDILPLLGSSVSAITMLLSSGIRMRIGSLFSSVCWLVYSIYSGSLPGTIQEITMSSVNLWTIYRMYNYPDQEAAKISVPVEDSLA